MGSIDRTLEVGPAEKARIIDHIDKMAMQALRVVGLAYIELSREQWNQNFAGDASEMLPRCDEKEPYYLSSSEIFEEKLRTNEPFFTWVGAFGMKDPLRAGVTESI